MSLPPGPSRRACQLRAATLCAALLLAAAPARAQERSGPVRDTNPAAQSDSTGVGAVRHPVPGQPRAPELPGALRRPPQDTRAPWPFGPRNRYAHTGVLVGAAAGTLLSLAEGRHPVPGAFLAGLLGYVVGMFFD